VRVLDDALLTLEVVDNPSSEGPAAASKVSARVRENSGLSWNPAAPLAATCWSALTFVELDQRITDARP
jgi:hypothetical protein